MFKPLITNEEVIKDWDWQKNSEISPNNVGYSNKTLVWWKCHKCNLEWQDTINNRARNKVKCPECSGNTRFIKVGYNDLATLHPNLMKDWDYQENEKLPTELRESSHYQAHWKCHKCKHKWVSRLDTRTKNGSGCPLCNNGGGSSVADYLMFYVVSNLIEDSSDVYYRYNCEGYESDVFIKNKKICIEIDGFLYHSNTRNIHKDFIKDTVWSEKGYRVYRVKERSDEQLVLTIEGNIAYLPHMCGTTFEFIKSQYIKLLSQWGINGFSKSASNLSISYQEIQSIIHSVPFNKSLASVLKYRKLSWDSTKNNVKPEDVYMNSTEKSWFTCKNNHSLEMRIDSVGLYDYGCRYCSSIKKEKNVNGVKESMYNIYCFVPSLRDEANINKRGTIEYVCPVCRSKKILPQSKLIGIASSYELCVCKCQKDVNITLTLLGKYDYKVYYTIEYKNLIYLIVSRLSGFILERYKDLNNIKELSTEFSKLGIASMYTLTGNNTNLLPFKQKDISHICFKCDEESIKDAINKLTHQKSKVDEDKLKILYVQGD